MRDMQPKINVIYHVICYLTKTKSKCRNSVLHAMVKVDPVADRSKADTETKKMLIHFNRTEGTVVIQKTVQTEQT